VDRLIALVALRLRLNARSYLRARESLVGLLLALPGLFLFSGLLAAASFVGLRALARGQPEALVPLLSAVATFVGLVIALSPLLSGVAWTEAPDAAKLLHYPVPLWVIVVGSLLAELAQPTVLSQLLVPVAVAVALSHSLSGLLLALVGMGLSYLLVVAGSHTVGLLLHAIARHRRLSDWATLVGVLLGLSLSLLPFLALGAGPGALTRPLRFLADADPFAVSPLAWGVRAAVHGGRGDLGAFALFAAAAIAALALTVMLSALLMGAIQRGSVWLGAPPRSRASRPWEPLFAGTIGALVEKDVRAAWREPSVRAALFASLIGPFVLLALFSRGGGNGLGLGGALGLAVFVGLGPFGANTFGSERRGIMLLLGFPVPRWQLLVGKGLAQLLLRLPSLIVLGVALGSMIPWPWLVLSAFAALCVWVVASGADSVFSVMFPVAVPDPSQNPFARSSGGRGTGAALVMALGMAGVLVCAAPFVFLVALPALLDAPWLWLASVPLALAGASAAYALLIGVAARRLSRRESDVVARILGDA
jgi:ABC-2 type transport system permease protein